MQASEEPEPVEETEAVPEQKAHPKIAEVFASDDPVARFMLALCAARNDVAGASFLSGYFNGKNHPMFYYATLSSWSHMREAANATGNWKGMYPEVKAFLASLDGEVKDRVDSFNKLLNDFGAGKHHIVRNSLFHYAAPFVAEKPCENVDPDLCRKANPDQSKSSDQGLEDVLSEFIGDEECVIQFIPEEVDLEQPIEDKDRDKLFFTFADQVRLGLALRGHESLEEVDENSKRMLEAAGHFVAWVDGCLIKYLEDRNYDVNDFAEPVTPEGWPNPNLPDEASE